MTTPERRSHRGQDASEAAHLQLQQVVRDFDLDECILCDDAGRLLATSGTASEFHRALAEASPRLAAGGACRLTYSRLNKFKSIHPNQVSTCRFKTEGQTFFITALGTMSTMRDVGMYRAVIGLRRITKEFA